MYVHFLLQVASSHPGMGTSSSSVQVKWSAVNVWDWEHHSALMWDVVLLLVGIEALGEEQLGIEALGSGRRGNWASEEKMASSSLCTSCGGARRAQRSTMSCQGAGKLRRITANCRGGLDTSTMRMAVQRSIEELKGRFRRSAAAGEAERAAE
jgi:hypothetical protein